MEGEPTDVAARGRALFDQLRAMHADGPAEGDNAGAPADPMGDSRPSPLERAPDGGDHEEAAGAGDRAEAGAARGPDDLAAGIGEAGVTVHAPGEPSAGPPPDELSPAVTEAAAAAAAVAAEAEVAAEVGPDPVGSDPVPLAPVSPDPIGPDPVGSDPVGSDAIGPDAIGPDPVAPVQPGDRAATPALAVVESGDPTHDSPAAGAPEARPAHPAAGLPLPRVLAIANQKGGVGKTTTTVNLGAALAELGYRTLVVDLDPQGNATTGLGINARNLESSVYDVLMHEVPLDECVEPTSVRNLFVAPATIDLAGAEIELVPAFSRELRLRRALADTGDAYDFTLIDCPPSLGLLTVNGLAAATEIVVPIQCEYYALEGLSQLMRNVNLVQSNLNPPLVLSAIILTMYDARTKLADQVAAEVRSHFGAKVCRHVVPRTVRLSEAPSFGQPIIVFDPSSRGALAYRELAKEVSGGAPQRAG